MNRKQWIVAGIIVALVIAGFFLLPRAKPAPAPAPSATAAYELVYCADGQAKPCVVSFSVDAWDNMLINFLLPDLSFPSFSLVISRGGIEASYACQRVSYALNSAYCAGPKQPPGEPLTLRLIANKDGVLLAEGTLRIIGLAFPTLGIAAVTPQPTPSAFETETVVASPEPFFTETLPPFVLPTNTKPQPTFYPGPSYP